LKIRHAVLDDIDFVVAAAKWLATLGLRPGGRPTRSSAVKKI